MVKYRVTVLKELPNWSVGETYGDISEDVVDRPWSWLVDRGGKNVAELVCISKDHPDFVSLEVDKGSAISTLCPKCSCSNMFFRHKESSRCDDGVRYEYATIVMVCSECGTEKELYTLCTGSQVYRW